MLANEKLNIEKRFLARSMAKMVEKLTGSGRADAARRNIFRRESSQCRDIQDSFGGRLCNKGKYPRKQTLTLGQGAGKNGENGVFNLTRGGGC